MEDLAPPTRLPATQILPQLAEPRIGMNAQPLNLQRGGTGVAEPAPSHLGVRQVPPSDTNQLLADSLSNDDPGSELSGFDSDMMTTEEMNEILESRNKSLIEHTLLLYTDKTNKWTKEMQR